MIQKAIIKSYDSDNHQVTVQPVGSLTTPVRASARIRRFFHPGTQTTVPFANPRSDAATTSSACSQSTAGILAKSDSGNCSALWNSVRVKPGHNACTHTPVPLSSSCNAWEKLTR